jgi:hypothetical protein
VWVAVEAGQQLPQELESLELQTQEEVLAVAIGLLAVLVVLAVLV